MERLHAPINSCNFGGLNLNNGEEQQHATSLDMEDKTPFLQMLQICPPAESSSFQLSLKLLNQKRPWIEHHDDQVQVAQEPESCARRRCSSPRVSRRKRKRTRPPKNKEEIESHRMTHIAVERNRRRQMNDHLSELRSLMPTSYVQRGDQASIVGGAIDFIKELEQILQSTQAHQKKPRKSTSSEKKVADDNINGGDESMKMGEFTAEIKSMVADIEATLIHNHVNLKIQCGKRHGQLIKAVLAMEDLNFTVLHLNITTMETSVHYSFNLKIEDGCKLGSAIEIAEAIHQIFRLINSC